MENDQPYSLRRCIKTKLFVFQLIFFLKQPQPSRKVCALPAAAEAVGPLFYVGKQKLVTKCLIPPNCVSSAISKGHVSY